jgi:hypothetical protein
MSTLECHVYCKIKQLVCYCSRLQDHHDYEISLSVYNEKESQTSIAMDLLARVAAPELLGSSIEKHFIPYVKRHDLNFDSVLAEYIMDIMERRGTKSCEFFDLLMDYMVALGTNGFDASWESEALTLIPFFNDRITKSEIVLEIMRRVSIPWSDDVEDMIQGALKQSQTKQVEEIQEQYRLMQLKRMLLRYDVRSFNISDLSLAKGKSYHFSLCFCCNDFVDIIRYIIRRGSETSLDDALMLSDAYHHVTRNDVHMEFFRYELKMRNSVGCIKVLEEMEASDALSCAKELLEWIEIINEMDGSSTSSFASINVLFYSRFLVL